jgi:Histidine kinase-, DNA gyrase B-, and HSP90-like ATPase
MSQIEIGIDPGRVLFGLSRIGYSTSSALCDIIDNSVRANATKIYLVPVKERNELGDSRRNNIKEYQIIDDGVGMSEDEILEALKLGSSASTYESNSLSKFGLGLKSAAFSQADVLKVISGKTGGGFNKFIVSLPEIISERRYIANKVELDPEEIILINSRLPEGHGTIVVLSSVRKNNHPSVKTTKEDLLAKIGVIYYYFLHENNLEIELFGDKIKPIDPLFIDEANAQTGNLDEHSWDGRSVRWIEKRKEVSLDEGVKIGLEITQLPYPPIFKLDDPNGDKIIRAKYLIGAKNYGFYVYRNKRLIAWASQLEGIVPQDQDFFAFRGRIFIDESADDFFNIDVKKSTLTLSEEAWNTISDVVQEGKRKSKNAWQNAGRRVDEVLTEGPTQRSNSIASLIEPIDILPGDQEPPEVELVEIMEKLHNEMKANTDRIAEMALQDQGKQPGVDSPTIAELSEDEKKSLVNGGQDVPVKVVRVSSVIDNCLWEPYYDSDEGVSVRVNKHHRFAKYIYEVNKENPDLIIIFELFLLQFAEAEIYQRRVNKRISYDQLADFQLDYRRVVSDCLANLIRKSEDILPPNH